MGNGIQDADRVLTIPNLQRDRSGTLRLISWWQQDRVEAAQVLVVGAGALGNEVIKNLTLMGVGNVFIIDRDIVEIANLSRSILFRETDEGRRKVEVAVERAKEVNPSVNMKGFHGDVTVDVGLGVFRRMDVVVGCLDSRHARLAVNNACWLVGVPWVDGAIQELFGEVRIFSPEQGACYACTLTSLDWQILREAHPCKGIAVGNILEGRVPTTPTISSIIAGVQSQEVLKTIHGMPSSAGKVFVFRGQTMESDLLTIREKPDCQSHYTIPKVIELKGVSAKNTTFTDLLNRAKDLLGADAILVFRQREIVMQLACPLCKKQEQIGVVEGKMKIDLISCPTCGHEMREPVTTHVFTGSETFAEDTLESVGIPPLDIIEAHSPLGVMGLELTGDLEEVLQYD